MLSVFVQAFIFLLCFFEFNKKNRIFIICHKYSEK